MLRSSIASYLREKTDLILEQHQYSYVLKFRWEKRCSSLGKIIDDFPECTKICSTLNCMDISYLIGLTVDLSIKNRILRFSLLFIIVFWVGPLLYSRLFIRLMLKIFKHS